LLKHPAWGVRRNVLRAMPRGAATARAIGHACAVNDVHGHVRLQALLALAESRAKPDSQPAIWTTYRGIDKTAIAAVDSARIDSVETRPCAPELYPADPSAHARLPGSAAPGRALRFRELPGGFRFLPDGGLPAGSLSVYDTRGRLAFAARYHTSTSLWNPGAAHGLSEPVYAYVFRGNDGSVRKGRIALLGPR
jgi:hypothetical protein